MPDAPTTADMRRYITTLLANKERQLASLEGQQPAPVVGLFSAPEADPAKERNKLQQEITKLRGELGLLPK